MPDQAPRGDAAPGPDTLIVMLRPVPAVLFAPHPAAGPSGAGATLLGGKAVYEEDRLSNRELFASWAGEDFHSWQKAIGASVTHLSRGDGHVTNVSQEGGSVSIHVRYARSDRVHPLWEFRTELTSMTLPAGLTRDDFVPTVKARRLLREQGQKAARAARRRRGWGDAPP